MNTETKPKSKGKTTQSKKSRADFDSPWKRILSCYFHDFIALCFPKLYLEIDWARSYESLDKELSRIIKGSKLGNRRPDKLLKVYLKNGSLFYILIHVEVQGSKVNNFEARMFEYYYRLYEYYSAPIVSIAILIDNNRNWRPNCFYLKCWQTSIEFKFQTIKLIDYQSSEQALMRSSNRFSVVILAQLAAMKKNDHKHKLETKILLITSLYNKGWSKQDVVELYEFIDCVLDLPEEYELQCRQAIEQIEGGLNMRYITFMERYGIEKGIEKGIGQGKEMGRGEMLAYLLAKKFKVLPDEVTKQIAEADLEMLNLWGERFINSESLEEIFV